MADERLTDGVFPLVTNDRSLSEAELLLAYKRQPQVEKRLAQLKSDYEVASVYPKEARRIQGLPCVYFPSQLVQALLERELRRAMEREHIESLPLYPEGRPCRCPTTRKLIDPFKPVQRHTLTVPGEAPTTLVADLTPLQRRILKLLGVPASTYGRYPIAVPNWSATHEQDRAIVGFMKETEDPTRREILGKAYTPLYGLQTSAGVVSTVTDFAKSDVALDRDVLIARGSREKTFTRTVSNRGNVLPYGLGWFVQEHRGVKLVWHHGEWPPTHSCFYLKVPRKNRTLILLANCAELIEPCIANERRASTGSLGPKGPVHVGWSLECKHQ
ncbi:MAG TPA: serine hydrolase [Thermoguttaceae bacterium]|nr:serine hydrolase [Thermoguttaceae bacterium]